jgi:hypothetical protein
MWASDASRPDLEFESWSGMRAWARSPETVAAAILRGTARSWTGELGPAGDADTLPAVAR